MARGTVVTTCYDTVGAAVELNSIGKARGRRRLVCRTSNSRSNCPDGRFKLCKMRYGNHDAIAYHLFRDRKKRGRLSHENQDQEYKRSLIDHQVRRARTGRLGKKRGWIWLGMLPTYCLPQAIYYFQLYVPLRRAVRRYELLGYYWQAGTVLNVPGPDSQIRAQLSGKISSRLQLHALW